MNISHLFHKINDGMEYCFNIESACPLGDEELFQLELLLADGFIRESASSSSYIASDRVVELGPRLNFATAWSSNMVSICHATGLTSITRIERSRRYVVPENKDIQDFIAANHDRMTECVYPEPLSSFETGIEPEEVYEVDLMSQGGEALTDIPGMI